MAKRKVEDIGMWARQTKIFKSMDLALKEARDQYWLQGSRNIPHLEMKMGKARNGKKETAFSQLAPVKVVFIGEDAS